MDLDCSESVHGALLRHEKGFTRVDGYVENGKLIEQVEKVHPGFDLETLRKIVREDRKRRYRFSDDGKSVRANQGHSTGVCIDFEEAEPPKVLYHGTAIRFVEAIYAEGLKPMERDYVHLSATRETARTVGHRHGKPVVLTIDAGRMAKGGATFWRAENGVWLTTAVPAEYISWADGE